jgi:hypothetical protein
VFGDLKLLLFNKIKLLLVNKIKLLLLNKIKLLLVNKIKLLLINKIKYKGIRQTHLVYLLFIVELATCFDSAKSSSGLYVKQVMLKKLRAYLRSH